MSIDAHKNFAYSTIATAPSPAVSGTSLVVFAGDGTKFPVASFNATVWPANTQPTTANAEIVRVTVVSTDTFTITRAQESSSARTIIVGDQIAATITVKTMTDVETLLLPTGATRGICQGRLTLTSGTPVTTADVTAATTVYFSPYLGNMIDLYDGSSTWNTRTFAEISIALGTISSGLPYDIFCFDNSGTPTLRAPVAWTNTTTRATALVLQNGVLVKTGATTDRYLGTFYTTSTTQTEDSVAKRFLWNYYNRVRRVLRRQETTASWAYTSATIRQANASASNQVDTVIGVAEVAVHLNLNALALDTAGSVNIAAGIGEDSTTAFAAEMMGGFINTAVANNYFQIGAQINKFPAIGRHVYTWLEAGGASNTFYGPSAQITGTQNGLSGWIDG